MKLAIEGEASYRPWFEPWWSAEAPIWAFCAQAPKKALLDAVVLEAPGALLIRSDRVPVSMRQWEAEGTLRLRSITMSALKEPIHPKFDKRLADAQYVLVDPLERFDADRRQAPDGWFAWGAEGPAGELSGSRERAMMVQVGRELDFAEDRAPRAALGRLCERPLDLWFREPEANGLLEALGGALVVGRTRPSPLFVAEAGCTALDGVDATFEKAVESLYQHWEKANPAARAAALASPRCAFLLGMREGPEADARLAACQHPFYALAYAREVDRGPHEATRGAACSLPQLALRYAESVDRGASKTTRSAVRETHLLDRYEATVAEVTLAKRDVPAKANAGKPTWFLACLQAPARVYVVVPGAPKDAFSWGLDLGSHAIVCRTLDGATGNRLAKDLMKVGLVSSDPMGPWVVARERAETLFADIPGVQLRPVSFEHRGKAVPSDHVLVDIGEHLPLDRRDAEASYSDPTRPWSAVARSLAKVSVMAPPRELVLARVAEFPNMIVVSPAVAERLRASKLGFTLLDGPQGHLGPLPAFPLWDEGSAFPDLPDDELERAFRAGLAGQSFERTAVLAHPWFALWAASLIDRAAADDSRAGACRHPHSAALYARFVDRIARDDTRASAATCAPTALFYAQFIDRQLTPATRDSLLKAGYRDEDFASLGLGGGAG